MKKEKHDFNISAESYDDFYTTSFGQEIDKIEKNCFKFFLEKIENKGISLEIGCGTGHWTQFFVENGFKILAIDIAEKMLAKAKLKNLKNVEFKQANILNLSYKNESFDNILAVTSLEFTENKQRAFDEIFRLLKNGGNLVIGGLLAHSELAKKRKESPVFKNADFFTIEEMKILLSKFGNPQIKTCLKIRNGKIIDNHSFERQAAQINDAFIVGFVKKINKI